MVDFSNLTFNPEVYAQMERIIPSGNGKIFTYGLVKSVITHYDKTLSDKQLMFLKERGWVDYFLVRHLNEYLEKYVKENDFHFYEQLSNYKMKNGVAIYNYQGNKTIEKIKQHWKLAPPVIVIEYRIYLKKNVDVLLKLVS
jgi:hypothetical protein